MTPAMISRGMQPSIDYAVIAVVLLDIETRVHGPYPTDIFMHSVTS